MCTKNQIHAVHLRILSSHEVKNSFILAYLVSKSTIDWSNSKSTILIETFQQDSLNNY